MDDKSRDFRFVSWDSVSSSKFCVQLFLVLWISPNAECI